MSFSRVSDFGETELKDLMELYRDTYWASDRSEEAVRRMLRNSQQLFGLRDEETGRMIAFARVVSDGVFIALLCDVIVHPSYRGKGVGRALMEEVMGDPGLTSVGIVQLNCKPDVIDFYGRWGFTDQLGDIRTMRRFPPAKPGT